MKLIDSVFRGLRLPFILFITAALAAGQLLLINRIRRQEDDLANAMEKASRTNAALEGRLNAVMYYKRTLKIDENEIPSPMESQSRLYSALIGAFSVHAPERVDIEKAREEGNVISFRVSGAMPYASLFNVLYSFRQSRRLIKITDLSLEGDENDIVSFAFSIAAITETFAAQERDDKKKAEGEKR